MTEKMGSYDFDASIAALSSPEELPEDVFDSDLRVVSASVAAGLVAAQGEVRRELFGALRNKRLIGRVYRAFIDMTHETRQKMASIVLNPLCTHSVFPFTMEAISSLGDSPQTSINSLAAVLAKVLGEVDEEVTANVAFALLQGTMARGRREGNAADYWDFLVQHHPEILKRAASSVNGIVDGHSDSGASALTFIGAMYAPREAGFAFPPAPMPTFLWVSLLSTAVRIMTHERQEIRDMV
ncbi:unnamed protein product [Vitrella brassicaformis CCMP3155]|uniref:Uncharacterized protein n=1 Tax=Vitrella brassicaformis (strain CCMP3155) TaxID=1169540 RepID=A0A0G4F6I4_VITBC|nr:unnamed protein product [Vitrella brassicaformis CCMP3155]|eukprot:CEM07861.1 unnamed protein product [Vitrella brassicaformis CCMP3155]